MKLHVFISTMNLKEEYIKEFITKRNLNNKYVTIINQTNNNSKKSISSKILLINYDERGLSKSRNRAIENIKETDDIVIFTDDDVYFFNEFEEIILNEFKKNNKADIIALAVDNLNTYKKNCKINKINCMKLKSVQLVFKSSIIKTKKLQYDENFGTGTENYMGEENIFLMDALNKKINIYNVNTKFARLMESESTWFEGYNKKFFVTKGKAFRRMFTKIYPLIIIRFAISKHGLYHNNITIKDCISYMFLGAKNYDKKK